METFDLKKCWEKNSCYFKTVLCTVWSEYGEIVNFSEISIGIYKIYDVWNEYEIETVPEKNVVNISAVCLLMMIKVWVSQGSFLKKLKENFLDHKQKHNVSPNLWHEVNTKNIDYFMVDNKKEPWGDSKPSVDGRENSSDINIWTQWLHFFHL